MAQHQPCHLQLGCSTVHGSTLCAGTPFANGRCRSSGARPPCKGRLAEQGALQGKQESASRCLNQEEGEYDSSRSPNAMTYEGARCLMRGFSWCFSVLSVAHHTLTFSPTLGCGFLIALPCARAQRCLRSAGQPDAPQRMSRDGHG